jgi:hypothetical protein
MNIKTGILAAAALTLAVPAAALAQPSHGRADGYRADTYRHDDYRRDDFRRVERDRDVRRAEDFRRLQWEREHHRYGYGYPYYR